MSDNQLFMAPDKTALRFHYAAVQNNFLTETHGRPIFDNVLSVDVMTPGSKESMPTLEIERVFNELANREPRVNRELYERYRAQVDAFKANSAEGAIEGTPITQWSGIDPALAATLRGANIFTVEQLAVLPDSALGIIGIGGHTVREKARAFVATVNFAGPAEQTKEIAHLREENAVLKERLNALEMQLSGKSDAVAIAPAPATELPVPAPAAPLGDLGSVI
jgi:hypothetical protein